jgi:hypothetical protein
MKRCSKSLNKNQNLNELLTQTYQSVTILKRQVLAIMGRNYNLCTLLMKMQNNAATMENSMGVLKELKIELPYVNMFFSLNNMTWRSFNILTNTMTPFL